MQPTPSIAKNHSLWVRHSIRAGRSIAHYGLFVALLLFGSTAVAHAALAPAAKPAPTVSVAPTPDAPAAEIVQLNDKTEMLHITAGRSIFLNTTARLRRVYVSDPAVLSSFTASPNQVLVTAKTAGVSSLVVWDIDGKSSAYTVSSDVDVAGLRIALASAFPHDQIEASALQNRVSLTGVVSTQESADAANKLAALYAKEVASSLRLAPVHQHQVQLRVRFAEVDRTRAEQFGVNFLTGGNNTVLTGTQQFTSFSGTTIGSAASTTATTVTNPLNLLLFNQNLNIGAAIADLEQKQILQILAEPTITSLSGVAASFLSGGEFPFPVVQGGSGSFVSVTVQFRPYGVKLAFTPYVNEDGTIRLKVSPEVSALDYTNQVEISGYDIPAIATRRADTEVELKDGQSFVISGLLDHRLTDAFSKMPGIASVPILGQLFRSKNNTASTVELVVIVTPQIIDPLTGPETVPELPVLAKPFLDSKTFDQQLNKKSTAPQVIPQASPQQP